ncbi:hypothetical protein HHK36_022754 [Tetracentron sinense]|uniref:Prefoldin subunit 2 n=1 Tax=Tetracentron sinense TaxID=13715 RepID=A0A834YQ55_TETSI|nr:hypothetical protein HHK36_022754 [Tetracentron sinense]
MVFNRLFSKVAERAKNVRCYLPPNEIISNQNCVTHQHFHRKKNYSSVGGEYDELVMWEDASVSRNQVESCLSAKVIATKDAVSLAGLLSGLSNGLLDPVLGFESCVAFIYMSFGDVRLRYFQEPKLGFVVEKNETQIMTSNVEGDGREPINEQAVANQYGAMRADMNQIYSKITELEMEASEHSLVIGAIQPLDPSRRCYRMIGGVLVERTIKEVLPAVQRNKEGLEEVISRLNEALEKKKKEIAEFEAKYKIRIRKSDSEGKDDGDRKEGSAQGVLVGPASATE